MLNFSSQNKQKTKLLKSLKEILIENFFKSPQDFTKNKTNKKMNKIYVLWMERIRRNRRKKPTQMMLFRNATEYQNTLSRHSVFNIYYNISNTYHIIRV